MLPIIALFATMPAGMPTSFTVRSLPVKNTLPSQLVAQLVTTGFADKLACLAANNRNRRLTISGPSDAVEGMVQVVQFLDRAPKRITLQVEVQEVSGALVKNQIELGNNQLGTLVIEGKQRHQLQLTPHLNGDKTISLMVRVATERLRPGISSSLTEVGMTTYRRFSPAKLIELRAPLLWDDRSSLKQTYLPLKITASVKNESY